MLQLLPASGSICQAMAMKVAIFHDYIGAIGGGERLALTLARDLGADLITTDANPGSLTRMGFEDVNVISLGGTLKVPPFKQILASAKFASCHFPDYEFYIFSGNWAHYAAAKHKPNLWYCHTPVRAFYDLRDYILENQRSPAHRSVARLWISTHKYFDQKSVKNINKIITNSENTKKRIKKYHNRDAIVVYPPVATSRFHYTDRRSYWLSVNRLYPEKRIPLQVDAFRRMPEERLKVVGGYSQGDHARDRLGFLSQLPDNVELLGTVSDQELVELYAGCKGLICTAMDEDFGITPVEAMAAGKPVVAVDEGGFRESVVDGVTGRLVSPHVEASLDNEELDLKVGFPINLTLQTGLGRLLSRFGCDLVVGDQVELEKWLLGKKCQFMTMNEKTDRGSFARVIPDSLKPLEKV